MKTYVEKLLAEELEGFRTGPGTVDQIFVIRQFAEKWREKNRAEKVVANVLEQRYSERMVNLLENF